MFDGLTLMSFDQLQKKYDLAHNNFFKFLQMRDFILRQTTLTAKIESSQIEKALLCGPTRGFIGFLYGILRSAASVSTLATKHTWERDLRIIIADTD